MYIHDDQGRDPDERRLGRTQAHEELNPVERLEEVEESVLPSSGPQNRSESSRENGQQEESPSS
jgi:hypothetical protein